VLSEPTLGASFRHNDEDRPDSNLVLLEATEPTVDGGCRRHTHVAQERKGQARSSCGGLVLASPTPPSAPSDPTVFGRTSEKLAGIID
jgi:hypothetical protein